MFRWLCFLQLLCVIFLSTIGAGGPGSKTRKAFQALNLYDYFKAKDLFYDALKRDSLGSGMGLSIIYSRNDNPFYNPDSAYKFVLIAKTALPVNFPSDSLTYLNLGVSPSTVNLQLLLLDSIFYANSAISNDLIVWNEFIESHFSEPYYSQAISERNKLAYTKATDIGSSESYALFIATYPDAVEVQEAKSQFEAALYNEITADGQEASFAHFIEHHPQSPYITDAENHIFELYNQKASPETFLTFIETYPSNQNVPVAWRKLYVMEIKQFNPKSIAAFTLKYPDYPYMEELQSDFSYAVTPFYEVKVGDLYGFIDDKGDLRIEPKYDWVEPFVDNLSLVGLNDKISFIKKDNSQIIDFIYDDAFSFKDGFAVVSVNQDNRSGMINRFGEEIIPIQFEEVGEMSEGMVYFEIDGLYGYADITGEIVLEVRYDQASDFKNGMAVVELNDRKGLIDRNGRLVGDMRWDWIEPLRVDGVPSRVKSGQKYGLINRLGSLLIDTIYSQIGDFHEGLALASNGNEYGFIDELGQVKIELKFTYSSNALSTSYFKNGLAIVYQDEKAGIIDTNGQKILPAMFEEIRFDQSEMIAVKKKGKWAYVDRTNKVVIDYKYDDAQTFTDSVAVVFKSGKFVLIDFKDKPLSDKYDQMYRLGDLIVAGDSALALLEITGNPITPFVYSEFKQIDSSVYQAILPNGNFDYYDRAKHRFLWKESEFKSE